MYLPSWSAHPCCMFVTAYHLFQSNCTCYPASLAIALFSSQIHAAASSQASSIDPLWTSTRNVILTTRWARFELSSLVLAGIFRYR